MKLEKLKMNIIYIQILIKILTPNKYPLKTKSIKHARILLREIKKKK